MLNVTESLKSIFIPDFLYMSNKIGLNSLSFQKYYIVNISKMLF